MDLHLWKIKNAYLLIGFLTAFIYCIAYRGIEGVKETIITLFISFFPLLLLFAIRAIGAGDVKLFFVLACFFSITILFKILIASLFLAGAIGIIKLLLQRKKNFSKETIIHYTIPIYLSVLLQIGGLY